MLVNDSKKMLRQVTMQKDLQQDEGLLRHFETLSMCTAHLDAIGSKIKSLEVKYDDLCQWFHMGTGKDKKSTDEFFTLWTSYLGDIKKALEALQVEEKKKQKAAE